MAKKGIDILNQLESIELKKPSDLVLEKIRGLILDGVLRPGDQLPTERDFAAKFNVGRSQVREAIKKLDFYGIVKTYPQSGTVVSSQGSPLLENMITNLIKLEKNDRFALVEAREILEVNAARLAAQRINVEQAEALQQALENHQQLVKKGDSGLNEDLIFHLNIARLSGNSIIQSMIMLITPEVNNLSQQSNSCRDGRAYDAWLEHKAIADAIIAHNVEAAEESMRLHLKNARTSFNL